MEQFVSHIEMIYDQFHSKSLGVIDYWMYNLYSDLIIDNLPKETIKSILSNLNEEELNYVNFDKTRKRLKSHDKTYRTTNIEIVYKSHFQFFEEYLSEIIKYCFKSFPYYMNSFEAKNEIPFDKIYNESNGIEEIRDFMITYRVKKIIQENNIVDTIGKIEKIFNFNFKIEKELSDILVISSVNRNALTHNNGIVNDIYIQQLKSRKIKTELKKGESVSKILVGDYFLKDITCQSLIARRILNIISSDSNRLKKHHDNLKLTSPQKTDPF